MQIDEFNGWPDDDAIRLLHTCAGIEAWAAAVVAGRPYPDQAALVAYADEQALDWTITEVEGALADHPRIGERHSGGGAAATLCQTEQAGVDPHDVELARQLVLGNQRYEERFGRTYLIRAAGRTTEQMLALLDQRLTNDDATEAVVTASELREIALLRLARAVT